jgi:hypothetical protein
MPGGRGSRKTGPLFGKAKDKRGNETEIEPVIQIGQVEANVNGVLLNRASKCPVAPGFIIFRNEGSAVEFRNIRLQPLGK